MGLGDMCIRFHHTGRQSEHCDFLDDPGNDVLGILAGGKSGSVCLDLNRVACTGAEVAATFD